MDNHNRTIVHIDIDCFYAQVEMIKQPNLKNQPLGIQQKNIVGIKKFMLISEAKKICPNLILVKGEDLYDYRQFSTKVSEILREYSHLVEKLGLDENFVDITDKVNESFQNQNTQPVGHIFGDKNSIACECGCTERLNIGSHIAQQMRSEIFEKLGLTTSAGIAINKLLAKTAGSKNKPNKQTIVYPNSASELIVSLGQVKDIPWIGQVSAELLNKNNIKSVEDLQFCDIKLLENIFDLSKAKFFKNLSFGIDDSLVKQTGKPQSIGLEDACKALTKEKDVEQKLKELLSRLLILIKEDGRIPKNLKVTLRKFDKNHPQGGVRESRQCNINTLPSNEVQIIREAMNLFKKMVNKSFKITLVGLSFSKFIDKPREKNTLTSFFAKENNKSLSDIDTTFQPLSKRRKFVDGQFAATSKEAQCSVNLKDTQCSSTSKEEIKCPLDIDKNVFKELPPELQKELWNEYRNKIPVKSSFGHKKLKTNTLFNYLVRQPKK